MVLVDTSVLIDFLKEVDNPATDKLNEVIEIQIPFGIIVHIYQELLQGTASQYDFNTLKKYLDTISFYYPKNEKESYDSAANIYFKCRKHGLIIRSSLDCIIAQIAIENNLKLLHNDRDFENIKIIFPKLIFL